MKLDVQKEILMQKLRIKSAQLTDPMERVFVSIVVDMHGVSITCTWRCDRNSQPWVLRMRAHSHAEKNHSQYYCVYKNMIGLFITRKFDHHLQLHWKCWLVCLHVPSLWVCSTFSQHFFLQLQRREIHQDWMPLTGESPKHIWHLNNQCFVVLILYLSSSTLCSRAIVQIV